MVKRVLFVAAVAAIAVPLAAAPAQASCRSEWEADLAEGYAGSPKSPYWNSGHVQVTGTATAHVYGDALIADTTSYAGDLVRFADTVVTNAPDATTTFVDCVAG